MTEVLQFVVVGVATGAVYTLLAQGIVVIHRASGVINLAQGAVAVLSGFLFASLVNNHGWAVWPAFAAVTLGLAVSGIVVYVTVMRPLRLSSQLTQIVATLGILVIIQSAAGLEWSDTTVV